MPHSHKRKVLIVDDDPKLLREVQIFLVKRDYDVEIADNALVALNLIETAPPDLIVLDITFPDYKAAAKKPIDGIEVLRRLRESGNIPVLMLSSTSISAVKVMALAIGADDYVSKPFDLEELSARVDAILRRTGDQMPGETVLSVGRLRLDPGERRIWKDGQVIDLTGVEFNLLYALARRPDHVFTREKLLEHAWKDSSYSVPKVVDVHIGHIRKKIEDDPNHPVLIETVRGTGYRLQSAPA